MRNVADQDAAFDSQIPNDGTVQAMEAARRGELVKAGSVEELVADLHAED